MNATEEAGKAVNSIVQAMKSAPLALALLVVNAGFIVFCGFLLYQVSINSRERNTSQALLIDTLIKQCGAKPPIMYRSSKDRQ